MKKRTFIKISSTLISGSMFSPLVSWQQGNKIKNWAGNFEFSTDNLYYASSVTQVQELLKKYSKLKVLGSRHCFNRIADSTDNLISLKEMDKVLSLDEKAGTVTVGSAMKYGQLCPYLDDKGFALHNLASLPHISIAGSCATATHGSGIKNGNLATAVSGMEMVTADGRVLELSREKDGENFLGAVVNLGALGVITKMTLNIEPTYKMRQDVYLNLPVSHLTNHFEEIMSAGYSVSLFTDWRTNDFNEVWIKSKVGEGIPFTLQSEFFDATRATKNLHPISDLSAVNCTEQMGVPGPWYERLPHFRMGFTPSSGKELQSEYFISRHNAVDAILAVQRLHEQISPHLLISEIRTIDADDLWMSPCYKQASVTIHFTWKPDWRSVSQVLPVIEKELAPFNARPHWGKLFTISPIRLQSLYEKLPDFQKLMKEYDPKGKFRNEFLNRNIYES
ncbi:D-arabinono-1,4-lactone oxidase [Segetibacter koreensis]|uniref:D-arabinono-1,4-lactone oxidase n=1 Tax=Segetibacter koreensis TaxID=398037 RepID=UPI0003A80DAD|nr:D-arabinono-1,4-lactone oxidase [Segetibacter koreensis]